MSAARVAVLYEDLSRIYAELAQAAKEDSVPSQWVDQASSPLGRRTHCHACRTGKFKSARYHHGKWLVRREELDAYIMNGKRPGQVIEEASSEVDMNSLWRAGT